MRSGIDVKFIQPAFDEFITDYDHAETATILTTDVGSYAEPHLRNAEIPTSPGKAVGSGPGASGGPIQYANANIIPDVGDSLAVHKLSDLLTVPFWWFLECFPFKRKYQDLSDKKKWKVSFWWVDFPPVSILFFEI